ncbi:uncharacterized protein LOC141641370 [Silene latifolia]|uniref:uncharacterized protein LOC141641370 n=1 Tax=Silene latifolia TaxID=37657 RepID=UPI003D76B665
MAESVVKRISSWNGVFLSPAGRMTLISSVLSSLSTYFLSVFKIPSTRWVDGGLPDPNEALLDPSFNFLKDLCIRDLCYNTGGWNEEMVKMVCSEECANKILAIPISSQQGRDEIYWPANRSGEYSVKSGYEIIFQNYFLSKASSKDKKRIDQNRQVFCKTRLWRLSGPQMWKILVWKIISNSLPVGAEFIKRKLDWEPNCHLCLKGEKEMESLEHLFRDCEIVSRIWSSSLLGIKTEMANGLSIGDWIIDCIFYLGKLEDGKTRILSFLATLFSIWTMRNNCFFRGDYPTPKVFYDHCHVLVSLASRNVDGKDGKTDSQDHTLSSMPGCQERENDVGRLRDGKPFYWIGAAGSCRMTTIHVDASWESTCKAAIGWVVYDDLGLVRFAGSAKCWEESLIQAEARGVLMALEWAREHELLHLDLASDRLQLLL